ncbi:MAG: YhjD/YihY/BrkB family envelope integrity protein, partial [Thermoanaerobaculia bacterium]|nr:YhjD/YihY/BrkB family envelope integrity protein [Thermoanaerobaculia bacterium]
GTFLLAVPWVFMGPAVLERLGLGWIWPRLHWPLGFALLTWLVWRAYVTLPKHTDEPPRLLLAAGAVLGTGLWALVTVGFRLYLANFDRFTSLYGVVTGIIVLMVWLHSSAFSVLLGAEVASTLIDRLDSSEEGSTEADEATDS